MEKIEDRQTLAIRDLATLGVVKGIAADIKRAAVDYAHELRDNGEFKPSYQHYLREKVYILFHTLSFSPNLKVNNLSISEITNHPQLTISDFMDDKEQLRVRNVSVLDALEHAAETIQNLADDYSRQLSQGKPLTEWQKAYFRHSIYMIEHVKNHSPTLTPRSIPSPIIYEQLNAKKEQ